MERFRISSIKVKGLNSPLWVLIPCFFVFCLFAFLGYCSFPVSDDFIMAQDAHKGFFWSINYWLGFWLSAWFTVAMEVSIPLAFGYLDYGIYFFIFIYFLVLGSIFFLNYSLFREKKIAFFVSILLTSLYILYNPSPAETLYWNIGALAYSGGLSLFFLFISVYLYSNSNLNYLNFSKFDFFQIFIIILFISFFAFWFDGFQNLIKFLDQNVPFTSIYYFWIFSLVLIAFLLYVSKFSLMLNYINISIFLFLCMGSGPQIAILILFVLFIFVFFEYLLNKKLNTFTLFVFFISLIIFIFILNLPGTKNRISLTHSGVEKNIEFLFYGIKYLFIQEFLINNLYISYFICFLTGIYYSNKLSLNLKTIEKLPYVFFILIFSLFSISFLIYVNANGHFPTRLVSNFVGIYLLTFFLMGIFIGNKQYFFIRSPIFLIGLVFSFCISPNLKSALEDIFVNDSLGFREYKKSVFREIEYCKSDTCEVTYKNFHLTAIPDQEFIFPGETGFPVSHKIFISRYFGKEFIRYNPKTLPPGLRK